MPGKESWFALSKFNFTPLFLKCPFVPLTESITPQNPSLDTSESQVLNSQFTLSQSVPFLLIDLYHFHFFSVLDFPLSPLLLHLSDVSSIQSHSPHVTPGMCLLLFLFSLWDSIPNMQHRPPHFKMFFSSVSTQPYSPIFLTSRSNTF